MNPDGSGVTQLTNAPGFGSFFSWSTDGKRIIYASRNKDINVDWLVLMNSDRGNKTVLTEPGSYIFLGWSPNGQKNICQTKNLETNNPQDNEIHVMDIDGENHYQWRAIIDVIKWTDDQHFIGHGWSGIVEPPSWRISNFDSNGYDPFELGTYPSRSWHCSSRRI